MQSDLFSVTKVLTKMENVVKYPKTQFIFLLYSHDPIPSLFGCFPMVPSQVYSAMS